MLESIFRAYDIRGIYPREIDEKVAYFLGFSTAQLYRKVVVGRDHRNGSEELLKHFSSGVLDGGGEVVSIGLVTNPLLQFSINLFKCDAGVMVTASHNPKEYNGFKIYTSSFSRADLERIKEVFLEVYGSRDVKASCSIPGLREHAVKSYVEDLVSRFNIKKRKRVVVDSSNGVAGEIAKRILESYGIDVKLVCSEIDPNFSCHEPDPSKEENCRKCKEAVVRCSGDVGICFDGDGDRAIFIGKSGTFIPGDFSTGIMALSKAPCKILLEVKASKSLIEYLEDNGVEVALERVGSVFLRESLKKGDRLLAGEYSGHYMFKERIFDDSMFAVLFMLENVEDVEREYEKIPRWIISPERRIKVENKYEVVERAREMLEGLAERVITIDGIRAEGSDFMIIVRASNTEEKVTVRFEARSKERYRWCEEIVKRIIHATG